MKEQLKYKEQNVFARFPIKVTLLMGSVFGAISAQTVEEGWVIENIHGPSQLGIVDSIPVDFNKDGLMDVVSASIDDGHLRAYINQGNLEFEQQYISKEVPGAFRVSATDINNDNQIDFLIPSIETNEIIALIADPNSQPYGYRKQIIAKNVLLPTDAQAGDFNSDGLMDVVSTSFEENMLLLHLQNKQGEFTTTLLSESPQGPRKLVVADFNNDQLADILVASSEDNSVRLFSNGGGALFTETTLSDQLTGIKYIAKCDDPDADYPDFVSGVSDANQILLFQNNTNNTFSTSVIDDNLPGPGAVICANLDQDQELEIISISSLEGSVYTHEAFDPSAKQLIANTRDGYVTVNVASFESNAQPLILTQSFFENRNLFYTPKQSNQESVVWEDFPDGVTKVVRADMNQDGTLDFVATSFKDDRVQWYDGTSNQHHVIADNIDGAADLVVGDFNQDGMLDVVSAASFANQFYWHVNLGMGQFKTLTLFENASFANSVETADMNNDGKLDVIGTSATDDSVRWFEFTNDAIQTHLIDDINDAPNDVTAGDVDGDGDIDLVVANFFSANISHYINEGNGVFKSQIMTQEKIRPYAVLLYSSGGNDFLNVVATISGDDEVWIFEQQQANQFDEALFIAGISNPRKLAYDSIIKRLFISSPNDQNILMVKNFPQNLEVESVVNDYSGVSDVSNAFGNFDIIGGSFDLNSIISINNDLIFKNGF